MRGCCGLLTGSGVELDQAAAGGQGMRHRHVVRLVGQLVEQLLVTDHRDQRASGSRSTSVRS